MQKRNFNDVLKLFLTMLSLFLDLPCPLTVYISSIRGIYIAEYLWSPIRISHPLLSDAEPVFWLVVLPMQYIFYQIRTNKDQIRPCIHMYYIYTVLYMYIAISHKTVQNSKGKIVAYFLLFLNLNMLILWKEANLKEYFKN